jgi:hypothetical protein
MASIRQKNKKEKNAISGTDKYEVNHGVLSAIIEDDL